MVATAEILRGQITSALKARTEATPEPSNDSDTQPAVVKNTGSSASVQTPDSPPAEGAAVQHDTVPATGKTALQVAGTKDVAVNDIPQPQYDPRDVAFSSATTSASTASRLSLMEAQITEVYAAIGDDGSTPLNLLGEVECIDAIESALGPEGFAAYCRGSAIKYALRAGKKGPAQQDLAKAAWYTARALDSEATL